ncbi:hypothetical protein MRB53_000075 [Persea americana]|uniref:Uncharacterized protein n=1 Tax=Persea americana TaxID=3435 RepID=A0ACC2MMS7_PERAE|nr:hypothetical protein MRB53_000075 [Persea americana]
MGLGKNLFSEILGLVFLHGLFIYTVLGKTHHYDFVFKAAPYTRLCKTKNITTINGQFPGPTIYARKGDTVIVDLHNHATENLTLHWHGVKQPRNPWSDGPEFITQCPVRPGGFFRYNIILSSEEGTLWWHAHSDWTRATVHGVIVIYPANGTRYPFPNPYKEVPIVIGEWWKSDVMEVLDEALQTGGDPNVSDAYTINGQPGDLFNCSKSGTFRMLVKKGKTYLLRLVNAAMNSEHFFSVANHNLTVVGMDGSYIKPITTNYVMITPGQTMDILIQANQPPSLYYMAAIPYSSGNLSFDNTTTTAILRYSGNYSQPSSPIFPTLPIFNDTRAATNFTKRLRSLADDDHPIFVPLTIDKHLILTVSVNTLSCPGNSCQGPNGSRLSASLNNISFQNPKIDILQAYYKGINGVFGKDFPDAPPLIFNFTADHFPLSLLTPKLATKVKVLEYNSTVELVYQGTNLVEGENHPLHLHGYSFYVVGTGFGNFDKDKDPLAYNLVDPPKLETVGIPRNGWVAIRFKASNPGVWFMHCHLERHLSWGMDTTFIVRNGRTPGARMLSPPPDMPSCY